MPATSTSSSGTLLVNAFGRGLHAPDPTRRLVRKNAAEHVTIRKTSGALVGNANLSSMVARVLNQDQTEMCWSFSGTALKFIEDVQAGIAMGLSLADARARAVLQSPLYFGQMQYGTDRANAYPNPNATLPDLADAGAELDAVCATFARWGSIPFATQFPSLAGLGSDVPNNKLPDAEVPLVETGATKPFGGEYAIGIDGNLGDTCAAALESGTPIWVGGPVGQNLQVLQAGQIEVPFVPGDPTVGGHARAVVGYKTAPLNGALRRLWLILNSWSDTWGTSGYSWAEESVLLGMWEAIVFGLKEAA